MGSRVLALACLVFAACGSGAEGPGSLARLTATRDLAERVHLAWKFDGPTPDAFHVERDGTRIASVRGDARSFDDLGAAAGSFAEPSLRAEASADAVVLRWDPVQALPGSEHVYTVVAQVGGDETGRAAVTGARGPQPQVGWVVLRDDETQGTQASFRLSWEDAAAEPGSPGAPRDVSIVEETGGLVLAWESGEPSPGPSYEYRVAASGRFGAGAFSSIVAGRAAPQAEAFAVYRDGALVERLPGTARTFVDEGAEPGRTGATSVSVESRVDAVALSWSAHAAPGGVHAYRIRALAGDVSGPDSQEVSGSRPAPATLGWRVTRDGSELVALPADATGYEDFDAEPAVIAPPEGLTATKGTRRDGVQLEWRRGSREVTHLYTVEALTAEGGEAPVALAAGRALPPLGYEVRRDGGPWSAVGDVEGWLDADAPPAVVAPMQAVATTDRYRGFADLRLDAPFSLEPVTIPLYEVRTVAGPTATVAAQALGYRGMDVTFQWKRRLPSEVDVPGADGLLAFDPSPSLDVPASWFLEVRSKGVVVARSVPTPITMLSSFASVSASWGFACGVRTVDHEVSCWSSSGQEGLFLPPAPPGPFASVHVGRSHACGLRPDGSVSCWGNGLIDGNSSPSPLLTFESLTSGYEHACAVRTDDRTALCWGANLRGQANPPQDVEFRSVSAGFDHTCGVDMDGAATCWGAAEAGVPPGGVVFSSVAAGTKFSCGVVEGTGRIRCWGSDDAGVISRAPTTGSFVAVTAGREHACAVRAGDRKPVCWGRDSAGETAPGPSVGAVEEISAGNLLTCAALAPDRRVRCWGAASPPPSGEAFAAVSAGVAHACGIRRDDGALRCWGYDPTGSIPRLDTPGPFEKVSAGPSNACAIRADDHRIVCWGGAVPGELTPPSDPGGYADVAVGDGFACALQREDGRAICWGPKRPDAAPIVPSDDDYLQIVAGRTHACGLRRVDRVAECWAAFSVASARIELPVSFERIASNAGRLVCGIRSGARTTSCFDIGTGTPSANFLRGAFETIAVGTSHQCGLTLGDRALSCNGSSDSKGQLGNQRIRSIAFESVSAGGEFNCGVEASHGRLVCWGDDWYGQAPSPFAKP